jgi:hypothetical protein
VRNRLRPCAIAVSLVLALPAGASAQKDDFVDAFVALSSALPAT